MIASNTHPKYESPRIVTYQEDEILKQMGPVGGCVSSTFDSSSMAPGLRQHYAGKRRRKYRSSLRSADLDEGMARDDEDLDF